MVARRKKLKEQIAAGNAPAEVRQDKDRKLKVEKRKQKKKQKKKVESEQNVEAEKSSAAEEALALEERRKAKRLKKEEKKKRKELEKAQNPGNADDLKRENKDQEQKLKNEKIEEPRDDNEDLVLNINAGEGGVNRKRENSEEADQKKKKKNSKKVDRWGAAVDEPAQAGADPEEDYDAGNEKPSEEAGHYAPKKVYVGGMPYSVSEDDIYDYFAECGAIEEIDYTTFPDTGKFRGLAFITFKTEAAAKKALEFNGADMGGRYLSIRKCLLKEIPKEKPVYTAPAAKTEGCTSVYIGNLSWDITEEDLKQLFKKCRIKEIRLAKDKESGEFRGYGHIDFEDDESLEKAVKLNQSLVLQRPIKIAYAVPPKRSSSSSANNVGLEEARKKTGCFSCGEEGHMSYLCPNRAS